MAGKDECCTQITKDSVRRDGARLTLRKYRGQGHIYVELRRNGRRFVFFCCICLAPCYSEKILVQHLNGKQHRRKYESAKITMLGPNPWPFNDGFYFFHSDEQENGVLRFRDDRIVNRDLVIPGAMVEGEMSSIRAEFVGFGALGARIHENDERENREVINRIWLSWLGKGSSAFVYDGEPLLPFHDYGVVVFTYNYNLGRDRIVTIGPGYETAEGTSKRRKLESTDGKEKGTTELASAGEGRVSKSRGRRIRKEMREQVSNANVRLCWICGVKLYPGRDAASLLNMKTGRFTCCSRNLNGKFHVFHPACLLHWILLCEYVIWQNQLNSNVSPRTNISPQPKKKGRPKRTVQMDEEQKFRDIFSVFCPECQGSGLDIEEDKLEKPVFHLPQMCYYKINMNDGQKAWVRAPEIMQDCSIGLHFPQSKEPVEEKVVHSKLLHIFRGAV